jgi:crotonobetainyl-CoA hydratase
MEYEYIQVEKKDHLMIITINRPNAGNSVHPPAHREMSKAFDEYVNDPDLWVAILTAAGQKFFCAGSDLKYNQQVGIPQLKKELAEIPGEYGGFVRRYDLYKPLICAVNGYAVGGGLELAMACDIIIASENAKFGLPEAKVGVFPDAGGLHRLTRQIPYHLAMGMIMTGNPITAAEAYRVGLVNEVVEPDKLMEAAERWANDIMACSPVSVRAEKEIVLEGQKLMLEDALEAHYPAGDMVFNSEDMDEGMRSFMEKDKPRWKNR